MGKHWLLGLGIVLVTALSIVFALSGPAQDDPVDVLVEQLGHEDPAAREAAAGALIKLGGQGLAKIKEKLGQTVDPDLKQRLTAVETEINRGIVDQAIVRNLAQAENTWTSQYYLLRAGTSGFGEQGGSVKVSFTFSGKGKGRGLDLVIEPAKREWGKSTVSIRCKYTKRLNLESVSIGELGLVEDRDKHIWRDRADVPLGGKYVGVLELFTCLLPFDSSADSVQISGMPLPILLQSSVDNVWSFVAKPLPVKVRYSGMELLAGKNVAKFVLRTSILIMGQEAPFSISLWVTEDRRLARAKYVYEGESKLDVLTLEPVEKERAITEGHQLFLNRNQEGAAELLRLLLNAELDYVRYGYRWWVGDISGLARILRKGEPLNLISSHIAKADSAPLPAGKSAQVDEVLGDMLTRAPVPVFGYLFKAVPSMETKAGNVETFDKGDGTNPSNFCICAFPQKYGAGGKLTLMISASNRTVLYKDTMGKPVETLPLEPEKQGWARVDQGRNED